MPEKDSTSLNIYQIITHQMGRPRNAVKPVDVTITAPPKLASYLDDLIAEQGFGASRGEVAKTLVWERIRALMSEGVLDRRRATPAERTLVAKRFSRSSTRAR
jgi:hypothetical protein